MRFVVALLAVTGCGRVAFDAVAAGDAAIDAPLVCPPGYTRETPTSCYRTGIDVRDWLGAEAACEADGIGAHLAVVSDAAEMAIIDRYRPAPTDNAWLGFSDINVEGTYRTVTNQVMTFLPWGTGEPDGATQDCGTTNLGLDIGEFDCTNIDDYVCEYDGIPAVSAAWGVCPAGYTFGGGSCYRYVPGEVGGAGSWFTAEADCEDDQVGTHLAILDDASEASIVGALLTGAAVIDAIVGGTDIVTEGTWLAVTNEPAPYLPWDVGEPNNGTVQNCLKFKDALLVGSVECSESDDYVCEYDGKTPVPASWGQ